MTARSRNTARASADSLIRDAAEAALAKKATDLVALDLRELDGAADHFLICSAGSEIQVKAIADAIEERLLQHGVKPWHIEGREGRRWVLLDYVDFVVHVFHERTREYYLLERLWGDAHRMDLGLAGTD